MLRAFGPVTVLAHHLGDVEGTDTMALFGSGPARYQGEAGPPPGDIDVLVIGNPTATTSTTPPCRPSSNSAARSTPES